MKVVNKINSKIPLIVKRIAVTCAAISIGLGSYGLITSDTLFIRIGGFCTIISTGLPALFGFKKDEVKSDE
jgi:1,4-dihydroxy-2-naphthoate octaprenyltransferase